MITSELLSPIKQPNLTSRLNREKSLRFLQLVQEMEDYGGEYRLHSSFLIKLIGHHDRPIGAYLRQGLKRFGNYVPGEKSFGYAVNYEFVEKLKQQLNVIEPVKSEERLIKKPEFKLEPRESGKKTGHRYYHWFTNTKKELRRELFIEQFGEMYEYDIQVARPTIILSMMDKRFVKSDGNPIFPLTEWRSLVTDRKTWREKLAADVGITYQQAKDLQQAITNGAFLSFSTRSATFKIVNFDSAVMCRLKQNAQLAGLRRNFITIRKWLLKTSSKKAGVTLYHQYEQVEDAVMRQVAKKLTEMEVPAWFIHDCFFTYDRIDVDELNSWMKDKFALNITFDEEVVKGRV